VKRICVVSVAVAVLSAAPIPAALSAPTFNWTGFYVGAYAGYGWGRTEATDIGDSGGTPWYHLGQSFHNDSDTFIGGGQAGYNFQFDGNWVAGLEADIGYLGLEGSGVYPDGVYFDTFVKTRASYDATFRGRLGVASGSNLFYVTGGAILANFDSYIKSFSTFRSNETGSQWGWTLGGGWEYACDPSWSIKAEYVYYDAGTEDVLLNNGSNRFSIDNTGNLVRVGLNFKLGTH
jgi:outer membrane immunogenic protein